jgi:hypothetical protein
MHAALLAGAARGCEFLMRAPMNRQHNAEELLSADPATAFNMNSPLRKPETND